MGEARAERREQHAAGGDSHQRRKVDEAQAPRRQLRYPPSRGHVARRARDRERESQRRDRTDGAVRGHVAPGEERARRSRPRPRRRSSTPRRSGRPCPRAPAGPGNARVAGGRKLNTICAITSSVKPTKKYLRNAVATKRATAAPPSTPASRPGVMPLHHRPVDRPVAVVGAEARPRADHDRRERGADGQVHHELAGHPVGGEDERERRDDDRAAADAQQSGEESDGGADREIGRELSHRASRR